MDDLITWDTTGIVKLQLKLPYERCKQITHQVLTEKCGHNTWHGFDSKDVDGGKAYHLWSKGISDDNEYKMPTGVITIYSDGRIVSQPDRLRDSDGTDVLPSPAFGDIPATNDFPQMAGFVLSALAAEANRSSPSRAMTNRIRKRQARVAELAGEHTVEQIAEMLEKEGFKNNSPATVNRDLKELGLTALRK